MRRSKPAISKGARVGITRYLQLYTLLAQELADGAFSPKQPLPSEPDLVKHYGVSRTTVRRALARLEREGRIVRRRGSGTYVRQREADAPFACAIQQLCDVASRHFATTTLHSGISSVPAALRNGYAELGARAQTVRRVRSHRGKPFQLEAIYFLMPAGKRSALASKIDTAEHNITATAADEFTARHLEVSLGTPLVRLRIAFKSADNRLLALAESLFRSDRCHLHATLKRKARSTRWQLRSG